MIACLPRAHPLDYVHASMQQAREGPVWLAANCRAQSGTGQFDSHRLAGDSVAVITVPAWQAHACSVMATHRGVVAVLQRAEHELGWRQLDVTEMDCFPGWGEDRAYLVHQLAERTVDGGHAAHS